MSMKIEFRKGGARYQVWCLFPNTLTPGGFFAGYIDRVSSARWWAFIMDPVTWYTLNPEQLREVTEQANTYATTLNVEERLKS